MKIRINQFIHLIGVLIGLSAFLIGCGNTQDPPKNPFVLSGGYYFNLSGQYPLIARTEINAEKLEVLNPVRITDALHSFYTFSYSEFLAAMIPDAGIAIETKFVNTVINSIDCVQNTNKCNAAGNYLSTFGDKPPKLPLILHSTDGGKTWNAVFTGSEFFAAVSDLDITQAGVQLNSVSCDDNVCVAVGVYNTATSVQPLLIVSNDGGASWQVKIQASTYAASAGTLVPVGNTTTPSAGFLDVSCSESICAAVGNYLDNVGGGAVDVFIAQSTDNGATWIFKTVDLTNIAGTLNTVDCLHGVCGAGGNDSTHLIPYFVVTTNNGNTWRTPMSPVITAAKPNFDKKIPHKTTLGGPVVGAFATDNAYLGVNCTPTICGVAGTYIATDTFKYPVVSIYDIIFGGPLSHPIGKTSYLANIYDALRSDKGITGFNDICCSDSFCTAGGTYYNSFSKQIAFMATSKATDTQALGNIWEYTITSNNQIQNISESSTDTAFNAIDCYQNVAVAVGRYNFIPFSSGTTGQRSFAKSNQAIGAKAAVSQFLAVSADQGENWAYEILSNNLPKGPNFMPGDSIGNFGTVVIGGY